MSSYFIAANRSFSSERRMRRVLMLSLLATVFFIFLAVLLLQSQAGAAAVPAVKADAEITSEMLEVLVPVTEIEPHTRLESRFFRSEKRPAYFAMSNYLKSFEELRGHYNRSLLIAGEPVNRAALTDKRPAQHIRDSIPAGYRAVTIRVNEETSVAGWAWPGARVDVKWITRVNGRPGLIPIVQNAEVLSAERNTDSERARNAPLPATVTLLVSAKEASKIQLASQNGTISLSLRGLSDPGQADDVSTLTLTDLLRSVFGDEKTGDEFEGTLIIAGQKFRVRKNGSLEAQN